MIKNKFKLKQKVYDTWWPWNIGVVVKIFKTKMRVKFDHTEICFLQNTDGTVTYDPAHYKFLRIIRGNAWKNLTR